MILNVGFDCEILVSGGQCWVWPPSHLRLGACVGPIGGANPYVRFEKYRWISPSRVNVLLSDYPTIGSGKCLEASPKVSSLDCLFKMYRLIAFRLIDWCKFLRTSWLVGGW